MLTIKTGVPGSGKTLSMAAELLQLIAAEAKGGEPRPLYTNITGLAIPHIPMVDWKAGTVREDGVLYTTDWQKCPPGSLVVIDEAFLNGYGAAATQSIAPPYITALAVHRKDYSLDLVLIAQHPKLLHVQVRRQVGKHQHYRRLFGWSVSVVYEWDQCQDNLSATKTAVVSRFRYPKAAFSVYKSAEVHTKPAFKKPWFIWIPVALVPLAAWAFPTGYNVMSGAMTGKGISTTAAAAKPAPAASTPVALASPAPFKPDPLPAGFEPPSPELLQPPGQLLPAAPVAAGCIATAKAQCKCFDAQGKTVPVVPDMCPDTSAKPATDLAWLQDTPNPRPVQPMQTSPLSLGGSKPSRP